MELTVYVDPWRSKDALAQLKSWASFVSEPVEVDRVFSVTYHIPKKQVKKATEVAQRISYVPFTVELIAEGIERLEDRFLSLATAVVVQKTGYRFLWTDFLPNYSRGKLTWSHRETQDLFYVPPDTPVLAPVVLGALGEEWQWALGPDPMMPWIAGTVIQPPVPFLEYSGIPMVASIDDLDRITMVYASLLEQHCFWIKEHTLNELGGGENWQLQRMPTAPVLDQHVLVKANNPYFNEEWVKSMVIAQSVTQPFVCIPWHNPYGESDELIQVRLFTAAAGLVEDAAILPWYNSRLKLIRVDVPSATALSLWMKQLTQLPSRQILQVPEGTSDGILHWLWDNQLLIKIPLDGGKYVRLYSYLELDKVKVPSEKKGKFDRTVPPVRRDDLATAYASMGLLFR
jgi:hypothetical protein